MIRVVSLSALDLSTQCLTPEEHVIAFGVCQDLAGGEAPLSNQ